MTTQTYITSEKFSCISNELDSRNWFPSSSSVADFLWLNLKDVPFEKISSDKVVNHFKGSQHLSNKALLAYHIEHKGFNLLPLNWSSAYKSLGELLVDVTLNSIYCLCELDTLSILPLSYVSTLREILHILRVDNELLKTNDDVKLLSQLLDCFSGSSIDQQQVNLIVSRIENSHPWRRMWGGTRNLWIVKPVGLSCGEQIDVVCGLQGVINSVRKLDYKCVVQKYVEKPMLVHNSIDLLTKRKFDIRQWILVTSIDPLVIYGFSECYLRLSGENYSLESDQLHNPKMHLCNHAIQKVQNNGVDINSSGEEETVCSTMLTQSDFNDQLVALNLPLWQGNSSPFTSYIKPKIKATCIAAVDSCRSKLKRIGKGFEWLGLDLMVVMDPHATSADKVTDILLLEVNVSPDISMSTPVTTRLVQHAVPDLMDLILEEHVLDWIPSVVTTSPNMHTDNSESVEDGPPRSSTQTSSTQIDDGGKSSPLWEFWYNGSSTHQNQQCRQTRHSASDARAVFRNADGSIDYSPRKLDLFNRVADVVSRYENNSLVNNRGGDKNSVESEQDEDEDEI